MQVKAPARRWRRLHQLADGHHGRRRREGLPGTAGYECPDFRTEFASVRRRKRYWTELFAVPLSSGGTGAVVTHVDITARKQAESALTRRATHDPLTGLPNRVLLADRLAHALSRAARTKTQVGLLFCDLDGFRNVNNTFGHLAGDRLLVTRQAPARCLPFLRYGRPRQWRRVCDYPGGRRGRGEVEEVARRIIEALTEPVVLEQGTAKTGTSIGLVISSGVPRAGIRTVENLIRDADSAMYAAKEAGRARYSWFSRKCANGRVNGRRSFRRSTDCSTASGG